MPDRDLQRAANDRPDSHFFFLIDGSPHTCSYSLLFIIHITASRSSDHISPAGSLEKVSDSKREHFFPLRNLYPLASHLMYHLVAHIEYILHITYSALKIQAALSSLSPAQNDTPLAHLSLPVRSSSPSLFQIPTLNPSCIAVGENGNSYNYKKFLQQAERSVDDEGPRVRAVVPSNQLIFDFLTFWRKSFPEPNPNDRSYFPVCHSPLHPSRTSIHQNTKFEIIIHFQN